MFVLVGTVRRGGDVEDPNLPLRTGTAVVVQDYLPEVFLHRHVVRHEEEERPSAIPQLADRKFQASFLVISRVRRIGYQDVVFGYGFLSNVAIKISLFMSNPYRRRYLFAIVSLEDAVQVDGRAPGAVIRIVQYCFVPFRLFVGVFPFVAAILFLGQYVFQQRENIVVGTCGRFEVIVVIGRIGIVSKPDFDTACVMLRCIFYSDGGASAGMAPITSFYDAVNRGWRRSAIAVGRGFLRRAFPFLPLFALFR
mmetsp:Transcript_20948/g.44810  ORF Transcript_20948/g.44810 Transcript_20948/m.44810 type:complete len:252 (-) Transcript_20948:189-944(-)